MKFSFHPLAEAELNDAVSYFDERQHGLGIEFAEEVYATVARIIEYPTAWAKLSKHTRRCLLNRFPYGVIYQIKNRTIRIIAIANLHRRPEYWQIRA